MVVKSGFLLVELMIGLVALIFFILTTAHYIIEVKNTQQIALHRVKALTHMRNIMEKTKAHAMLINGNDTQYESNISSRIIKMNVLSDTIKIALHTMKNTWKIKNKKYCMSMPICIPEKDTGSYAKI